MNLMISDDLEEGSKVIKISIFTIFFSFLLTTPNLIQTYTPIGPMPTIDGLDLENYGNWCFDDL